MKEYNLYLDSLDSLYSLLKSKVFSKRYVVKHVLPDWWNDKICVDYSGVQLWMGYVSKKLNIDYLELKNVIMNRLEQMKEKEND